MKNAGINGMLLYRTDIVEKVALSPIKNYLYRVFVYILMGSIYPITLLFMHVLGSYPQPLEKYIRRTFYLTLIIIVHLFIFDTQHTDIREVLL